jgi:IMP dehydrogenase/GMP reductase
MIQQAGQGLNSRKEAIPFDENGFLPLITAPMYSVVDETNYQTFLDNKIQVCLPRKCKINVSDKDYFISLSLEEFSSFYCNAENHLPFNRKQLVCIDTANGNMPALHDAIREAKEIHGDNLIIMTGNVSNDNAFVELAKTGVDYIRVGIGGGGGCNTTSNTGVGQGANLVNVIWECNNIRSRYKTALLADNGYRRTEGWQNIAKVKIVADGISSYVKYCEKEHGFNNNGYAAINTLLYTGADLVMVGSLFAQCLESAGEKRSNSPISIEKYLKEGYFIRNPVEYDPQWKVWDVKLQGMSTEEAQNKYKKVTGGFDIIDFGVTPPNTIKHSDVKEIKPSEGKTVWLPVKWMLNDWLYGNGTDELPGFINMLKSAMAYRGAKNLKNFPEE